MAASRMRDEAVMRDGRNRNRLRRIAGLKKVSVPPCSFSERSRPGHILILRKPDDDPLRQNPFEFEALTPLSPINTLSEAGPAAPPQGSGCPAENELDQIPNTRDFSDQSGPNHHFAGFARSTTSLGSRIRIFEIEKDEN